jgi:hypothetical protein
MMQVVWKCVRASLLDAMLITNQMMIVGHDVKHSQLVRGCALQLVDSQKTALTTSQRAQVNVLDQLRPRQQPELRVGI